jgi:hypothetical protein
MPREKREGAFPVALQVDDPGLNQYSVTGDGKKFLFEEPITNGGAEQITVVLNWAAGLKR